MLLPQLPPTLSHPSPHPPRRRQRNSAVARIRRRYNLKQPKAKSTLDARNIFLDNDFTYIDDVDRQGDSNNHISIKGNSDRNYSSVRSCETKNGNTDNCADSVALVNFKELDGHQRETDKWLQLQQQGREGSAATIVGNNFADDYDDICDVVDNAGNRRLRLMNAAPQLPIIPQRQQQPKRVELATQCHKADHLQQMRHDKSFHNSSGNTSANDKSTSNNNNICDCENDKSDGNNGSSALIADNCEPKVAGGSSTTTGKVVGNNCAGACKSDKRVVCEQQQQKQLANDGLADDHKNDQQKIQRLSDSELKHSNINCKGQQTQQKQHCVSVKITGDSGDFSELQARVNCQLDSSTTTTAPDSNRSTAQQKQSQNNSINYNNDKANNSESDSKIDLQNKMTITTTNAASRKHSRVECGLRSTATTPVTNATTATTKDCVATDNASTATTTEIAPCSVRTATNMTGNTATTDMPTSASASASVTNTATTIVAEVAAVQFRNTAASPTPSSRPSTPSLTTVIKTTLVKRTPSTESSKTPSPVTTPTTITKSIVTATVSARAYNSVGNARAGGEVVQGNPQETTTAARPRTSVKQRIAAFAAGNEQQTRNHDNSIKLHQQQAQNHNQIQSNGKQNMTRKSEAQPCTTNGESSNASQAHVMGGTEIAKATETAASRAAATPQSTSVSAAHTAVASTPVTRSAGSSLARSTGYATMPRRSVNNSCAGGGNNAKCGSGCAVNHNGKAAMSADNTSSDATADNCRKLAATLDNLDLAVVRDLTDDDGEDSYTAFQEYLERVEQQPQAEKPLSH
ncbi:mucin-5AC-like [Bactrocera neohumeralis]|uniref:mucin-5AC-like n=1 Tax=Bactrocera neohumeralis TaxID=98809 RepID=UPI0021653F80|nr:mucin-5AC-like [Bactrocera neohumeralis]